MNTRRLVIYLCCSLCGLFYVQPTIAQNGTCITADAFCSDGPTTYPAGVGTGTAEAGPDYGCLLTQPNPAWFFMEIVMDGNLNLEISNSNNEDLDFIMYGPFADASSPCTTLLTAGNTEDCSYSSSGTEFSNVVGATAGDFYILMVTNFSNNPTDITISSLASSTATSNCAIVCGFTDLSDVCLNDGVQTGLTGGGPPGGVYSGAGVTDDGNGMTFSFDPVVAGTGVHTITYTNSSECSDPVTTMIEVISPAVSYTAPMDVCANSGSQAGLGGGTPSGGVYSGTGVTDDGNGMTYSFDPAAAGVGVHTLTYDYTDGSGCSGSSTDMVEVFASPNVSFTALADLCVDGGVQSGFGGGTPSGGVYSGIGVTDDGNGMTYSFDPAAAGVGVHTLTYDYTDGSGCSGSSTDMVEVFASPNVSFTALADLCVDGGVQSGLGGGTPSGGVYSGTGVTDDGNGMTYSFDPAAAGVGVHTLTYEFTDGSGCSGALSDDATVFDAPMITSIDVDMAITCFGACDGQITASVSGGIPPYTYAWEDGMGNAVGGNSATISALCADTYSLTVTDAGSMSVFWSEDFGLDPGSCSNQNQLATAALTVNGAWAQSLTAAEGGVPNQWFVSATEAFTGTGNCGDGCLGNAALDNQTLHIGSLGVGLCPTGDCGARYSVGGNAETHKRIESPVINCTGRSAIELTFDYMHFGEISTDAAGLYYFDGALWMPITVTLPQTTCCGGPCGALGTTGQWSPVRYLTTLPASADNNPNVRIGFTWDNDANNSGSDPSFAVDNIQFESANAATSCSVTSSFMLTQPAELLISNVTTTDPTCGNTNGSLMITANGGTPPVQYSIDNGVTFQASASFSNLGPGTYNIVVEDANGCQAATTATLTDVGEPMITNVAATDPTCGNTNGSVMITVNGGTPPVQYSIDNGVTFQASASFSNLGPGTYDIVVEDANGCQASTTATLTDVGVPIITNVTTTDPTCGNTNGSLLVTANGGTPPLQYSIDNGVTFQASASFSNLVPATYNIIVEDANGCQATTTMLLEDNGPPVIDDFTLNFPDCVGNLGQIDISASGGTGPLMYSIDGGMNYQMGSSFINLPPGDYLISVIDQNNCTITSMVSLPFDGSACDLSIADPCSCLDNATVYEVDANTGGDDGQFSELVTISGIGTLPPGLEFVVVESTGAYDAFNIPPVGTQSAGIPLPTDGSLLMVYNSGVYELPFVHADEIGYSLTIELMPSGERFEVSNICQYPDPAFLPALQDVYCIASNSLSLGGVDLNGPESDGITFQIDGLIATDFDPAALGIGVHTVLMTFDGADDGNGGISPNGTTPASPGCIQTVQKEIEVVLSGNLDGNLNCRDINLSVDINGNALFTLDEIASGSACLSLDFMIQSPFGGVIYQESNLSGITQISLPVCNYLSNELKATISNSQLGSCWSHLTFKQSNGPVFKPGRVANVWCTDSLVSGGDIEGMAPEAYIPCVGPVETHFVADWVVPYDCEEDQDTAKVIYREYEAFDKEGKRGSIFDTIVVFRLPQIHNESIFCTESTTLYCGDTIGWQGPTAFFAKGGILPILSLDLIDVGYDENGDLDFRPIALDPKCGLQVHVDYQKFTPDLCEQQYKVTIELKQSCPGGLNEIALTPGATDMVGGPPIPPNVWVPLTADYTYWKCEFWVTDLDTLAPVAICKGEPFFAESIAQDKWTFNTIRDFDFLDTNFLGGLVGDIPAFDDIMIPDYLTMLDTSKAPSSVRFASEQILMDPDLYLGLNLGFVEATEATEFTFDWDFMLGAFDRDNTIFDEPGAIGLIGYGINGTFYKLVEGIEEPLLDEFEPYQDFLEGIMDELEVDAELCNLNISLLLEDSWGETTIRLEAGDVFTMFGIWVSNSDASITFSGENLIATNTHECAAHTYVPPLYVQEDWSGIKLVKATIDGIGTVVMDYDEAQGCYVSHQLLKLPHRATPYVVEYEVFDSCHNVGYELCYLKVKDRTDPVAVADKGVTVSLTDKKVWVDATTFDEGSADNCGVNWILARRADWSTACVNLCYNHADTLPEGMDYKSARFPIWTDGHDTLWCLDLEDDKAWDAVEAHYAKQLEWWCIDGADCGEIIYNSWIYDLIKEATLACSAHSYLDDEGFYDVLYKALQHPNADPNGHLNGLLESKFKCEVSKANAECVLPFSFGRFPLLEFLISGPPVPPTIPIPILSPLTSSVKMMYLAPETGICGYNDATIKANLDTWSQIGGGWSDAVPFSCEDACGPVTVEILVMDYWCNWSTAWTTVWVEDKTPIEVAKDVVEEIEITCATYKADQYYYPGESHAMGLDDLVALGKDGDSLALSVIDTILGGYCKAWRDPYGNYVDIDGNEIDCDIHFSDAYCHCEPIDTQIRVYDDHFGYIWKDSTYTKCYYETEDVLLQKGVVVVNCAENVYCEQELWCEFDHCGQGYIFRKWKIWQGCPPYNGEESAHIPDTIYRHQRIWVGNECELSKYMFDVPGDMTVTSCALEYDPAGSGQLVGDLDPEITGYPVYKFDDDCRIVGIGHQDKVFKVVGGDEACYKVVRTWYFADWCGGKPVDSYWWYDRGLIIDSCVQKIIVQDTVGPVCTITGPVSSGDTIEVGACAFNFAASVSTSDACGVISYSWVLKQVEAGVATEVDSDHGALSADTTDAFDISSPDLLPGVYKLVVTTVDECQNEGVCEYDFTLLSAKKPTPVCITLLTATLTPWDTDSDGVIDSAHAVIWASEFNSSSALACEDDSLAYRIEFIDGIDDDTYMEDSASLDLTCANIGTKLVRLWVLSYPSGTADYCDVILMVQSDGEGCDVSSSHTPSGKDMAESGEQGETPDHTGVGSSTPDIAGDAPQIGGTAFGTGEYSLEQNRPNPFREETLIEFSLPEAMEATITIYDVTGRQLRQIQGDFSRGYNQVQFRKEGLHTSGILFYQLRTAEYTEVKRMMLVD